MDIFKGIQDLFAGSQEYLPYQRTVEPPEEEVDQTEEVLDKVEETVDHIPDTGKKVEEAPEEVVNHIVDTNKMVQDLREPDLKIEQIDPSDFLFNKWKDELGMDKETFDEKFAPQINATKELTDEINKLRLENATLNNNPVIRQSRTAEELNQLWLTNKDVWEEELKEIIPDEYAAMGKLPKKQMEELNQFLVKEVTDYMIGGKTSGKPISNPLMAISSKLVKKLNTPPSTPPKQNKVLDVQHQKKLASVAATAPQIDEVKVPKGNAHMNPTINSALENISNLFSNNE